MERKTVEVNVERLWALAEYVEDLEGRGVGALPELNGAMNVVVLLGVDRLLAEAMGGSEDAK